MEPVVSKKRGDLVVIMITGSTRFYIAEVIQEEPLRVKVDESGPYANLKDGDFILDEFASAIIQDENDAKTAELLAEARRRGYPFLSGLELLGVSDGKMHEMLPAPQNG